MEDTRPVLDDVPTTSESQSHDVSQGKMEEVEEFAFDGDKELNDEERVQLYDKGMKFKANHNYTHALLCFLGCLKGLEATSSFPALPSCLQHIASIYAKFEDFPKAVQFMQAAKMYYEIAIIGTQDVKGDDGYQTMDENAVEDDAKRANEYERLSHDCIRDKNVQLALEYCGKATQLRRKVYGEHDSVTIKSLDLFTMIYAEMGKMQYSEAINKFDKKVTFKHDIEPKTENEDVGIVSQKSEENNSNEKTETTTNNISNAQQELEKSSSGSGKEYSIIFMSFKQFMILLLISAILAMLFTYVWCQYTKNDACPSFEYLHERSKFYYYYYVQTWLTDSKFL